MANCSQHCILTPSHTLARRLAFVLALLASPAVAQQGSVESLGARSCAELVEARDSNPEAFAGFTAWIGGFLSATNALQANTFDLTPWQPIELAAAQLANACKQQPDAHVVAAMVEYIRFLHPSRLTEPSEMIQVRNGQQAVFVYKAVLADIRTKLTTAGAKITDPVGTYGDSFGKAVLAFQSSQSLKQTGLPDLATLIVLYR